MRRLDLIFVLCLALPVGAADRGGVINGVVRSRGAVVRDAIVYLGGVAQPAGTNLSPAVLDQLRNEFLPRIQVARSGAPLVVQNSDAYLHVLRIESLSSTNAPRVLLRMATPYAGFEKRYKLPGGNEPMLLRARGENGFEKMTAYIAVLPHPWAAITDEAGRYRLTGVPTGEFKLYLWHERFGTLSASVRVNRGRETETLLEFPAAR